MNWINNNKLLVAGICLGAVAGFLYWKLVGCNSGTCMITSKWHNSTAYGAVMGGLLFSIFKKEKKQDREDGNSGK
jgi:H+/Cl- antiporter ClcA